MSDGKGTPLFGDRSAWDTINYPKKHAKDVNDETPTIHVPTGNSIGDQLVWNGSQWILSSSGFSSFSFTMGIDDLIDVDTSSTPPTDGQALIWDEGLLQWVPGEADSSVTVNDTSTVDLTFSAGILTADVIPAGIKLDDLGTPDDNTDLDVTSFYHGLMKKLPMDPSKVFNGSGSWVTPPSGGASALADLTDVTIPTPVDQDVLTFDTASGKWISQASAGGGGGSSATVICAMHTTTSQSVPNSTDTPLTYEISEELLDPSGMHDGTNKSRINILEDGVYELHGQAEYASVGSSTYRFIYFRKTSGGTPTEIGDSAVGGINSYYGAAVFTVVSLLAGDYVELLAYQVTGGSADITRSSAMVRKLSLGTGYTEGARAYNASSQTLISGVDAAVNLDTEEYDTNVTHDNSTNNTRFTCKTAGKYQVNAAVAFGSSCVGYVLIYILMHRGATVTYPALQSSTAVNGYTSFVSLGTVIDLQVNDYIELMAQHNTGSNRDISGGGPATGAGYLAMQRIG